MATDLHEIKNQIAALSGKIELKLNSIEGKVSGIENKVGGIEIKVGEVDLLLRGDGGAKTGVVIDVDRLKQTVDTLKQNADKLKDNTDRTFWSFVGACGLFALKTLWEVLTRKI